jgi:inosine-uridine nucleoside N-ribohydrolase
MKTSSTLGVRGNSMQTESLEESALYSDIILKVDPEAARIAQTADFPNIVVVGNVASTVLTTEEYLDELYEVKNPYTELLHVYFGSTFAFWDVSTVHLFRLMNVQVHKHLEEQHKASTS